MAVMFSDAVVLWLYPLCTLGMWFVQPWFLEWGLKRWHWFVGSSTSDRSYRATISAATRNREDAVLFGGLALLLMTSTGTLATFWHASMLRHCESINSPNDIPTFGILLLWYPLGIQVLRYLHCASVGPSLFCDRFGLLVPCKVAERASVTHPRRLSSKRIKIFMWSMPTVIFSKHNSDGKDEKFHIDGDDDEKYAKHKRQNPYKKESWREVLQKGTSELLAMVIICGVVLYLDAVWWPSEKWPWLASKLLQVLVLGLSMSLCRILFEVAPRWWLSSMESTILPLYTSPLLAASPRDFWRRWSVSAGFHLKEAYYLPRIQNSLRGNQQHVGVKTKSNPKYYKILVAAVPFAVNAALHSTWWSLGIIGGFDLYSYQILLLLWPLGSLALQDALEWMIPKQTKCIQLGNRALVWIGFCLVVDCMQASQGAPPGLKGLCRGNLLLPT